MLHPYLTRRQFDTLIVENAIDAGFHKNLDPVQGVIDHDCWKTG